ncbi:Hsp20/alpha crystallin family protein [Candidatus Marimicrobium litorale]|uniref:Hsp20/alpha crystallin family protein n=1 Tax=Candidatus Marimicrobium litorale TaxID=2518991 RepID=A0ABT3T1X5_9GAMM|nr:Hsp20/alpha crystallin family protein [Candidatus Marimicrobium litorale]MCX2976248.1 Hsp20/alpha crystallin family protein [Candidatus Marimicrobium litorale]
MSLISRNNLFDFDGFFSDSFQAQAHSGASAFLAPRVDIQEQGDHYEITAELPGIDKDDIHVHVKEGVLTLEAERVKKLDDESKGKIIRQERASGKYRRTFKLGENVQESDIEASFKDGVLTLQAPKQVEKVKERRRIDVH